ncbi:retrovirus-related pol polyprotein from transposon TNT 1-94 [Tanacetum coccineum]
MTGAKFDIEKFDRTSDFGLWRIKMCALLIKHGFEAALEVLPANMEAEAKAELNKEAHSVVILCLGDDGDERTSRLDWIHGVPWMFIPQAPRYIPELKRNLISLGTLENEGFTVKIQSGKVKVIKGELNGSVEEKNSLAQVWHKRLGHISEARLHVLEQQGLFGKKSLGKLDFCENYVLGKSHREGMGLYPQVQTQSIWKVQIVEAVSRELDWEDG